MAETKVGAQDNDKPRPSDEAEDGPVPAADDETASEPDIAVQDWVQAERSRPTLPDETADGLDDMDEEVRRQAEDGPLDTPGRLR